MAYQERDNSGALFKNDRKEKENQPDYKGTAMVNGVPMEMSAWVKTSKAGNQFMSFAFSPKREPQAQQAGFSRTPGFNGASRPQQNPPPDQFGNELPF